MSAQQNIEGVLRKEMTMIQVGKMLAQHAAPPQVGMVFAIRNGNEHVSTAHSPRFSQERMRGRRVFQHLEEQCCIESPIGKRQALTHHVSIDSASARDSDILGINIGPRHLTTVFGDFQTISTCRTTEVQNPPPAMAQRKPDQTSGNGNSMGIEVEVTRVPKHHPPDLRSDRFGLSIGYGPGWFFHAHIHAQKEFVAKKNRPANIRPDDFSVSHLCRSGIASR